VNPQAAQLRSLYNIVEDPRSNHRVEVRRGVLAEECRESLEGFFEELRNR